MIILIFHYWMNKQNMLIYGLSMILLMIIMFSFMQLDATYDEQVMFKDDFQLSYEHLTLEYLSMMMPFMIVMISMHHESKSLYPIYAYVGRNKTTFYKMLSYILFITWYNLTILLLAYLLPYLFTMYYTFDSSFLIKLMMVINQNYLVLITVFICIKDRHQNLAILLSVIAIIFHMILEDHFSMFLFYLWPFYDCHVLQYKYQISYQMLFILLGFMLSYLKMTKSKIN